MKRQPLRNGLCQMKDPTNAVEFEDLQTCFFTDNGILPAADGVSFDLPMGQTVAVVGESGCGKSVTSLSLMQLLPKPQAKIIGGSIRLNLGDRAVDVTRLTEREMVSLRGSRMAMIFQEPMTALNPVFTIGSQLDEAQGPGKLSKKLRRQKSVSLLETVGIANGAALCRQYPHQLSGGMRQRVMIAIALAQSPRVIIADEPTTALDVTIQAQILELLKEIRVKTGCAILLITHDLGVVAGMADQVVVMYAGRVVERGTAEDIFYRPAHPYTRGLMASKPVLGKPQKQLYAIGGRVPDPLEKPEHCYFYQRCDCAREHCQGEYPQMRQLSPTHFVSCYREESYGEA